MKKKNTKKEKEKTNDYTAVNNKKHIWGGDWFVVWTVHLYRSTFASFGSNPRSSQE